MSHYFVAVMVQPDTVTADTVKEAVTTALAPFDENMDVPTYQKKCYCVGNVAEHDARHAAESFHPLDAYRAELRQEFAHLTPMEQWDNKEVDQRWKQLIAPYQAVQRETFETHPLKEAASPTCEECQGTGTYASTYNPQSKWDWYTIGGRWSNILGTTDQAGPWQTDPELRGNCLPARLITPETAEYCYAIIDPLGKWNSEGRMGWFGISSDDDPSWPARRNMILAEFPDAICVGMDLHI